MNIYWMHDSENQVNEESWDSLKAMVMEWHRGIEMTPDKSSPVSSESFILRNSDAVIWGRMFGTPLSPELLAEVMKEIEAFRAKIDKRTIIYLFFPLLPQGLPTHFKAAIPAEDPNQHSCWLRFIQYQMLHSEKEPALGLREGASMDWRRTVVPAAVRAVKTPVKSERFDHRSLNRAEIEDLLELSLSLRSTSSNLS